MKKKLENCRALVLVPTALLAIACANPMASPGESASAGVGKADGRGIEDPGPLDAPWTDNPRIVGGERTSEFPAVVALLDDRSEQFCTGTLIGERTVLTAAHCISDWYPLSAVYFGADADLGETSDPDFVDRVPVVRSEVHPDYDDWAAELHDDFAVLELERAPSGAEPMAINNAAFKDSMLGASLVLVGFGNTDGWGNGGGKKRVTQTELDSFTDGTLYWEDTEHNTCHGDSGGPAFFEVDGSFVQVGITSYGDPSCTFDGVDMRVDDGLAFIEGVMSTIGDMPVYVDASTVGGDVGPSEPSACDGTYYDGVRVCRSENGAFAKTECCEKQCFDAYYDSAGRCRRGDAKFAPAFCCDTL